VLAPTASAATVPVPADAPVVATSPSGAAVLAWHRGGRTCTAVRLPGAARPTRASTEYGSVDDADADDGDVAPGNCGPTPVLSRFDGTGDGTVDDVVPGRTLTWGTAGRDTAAVAFKRGATVLARADTAAATLPPDGVGELRFWAAELPGDDADKGEGDGPAEVALLDAAGVVRRAEIPVLFGAVPWFGDEDAYDPTPGTPLTGGRAAGTSWQLRRTVDSVPASTPLEPERQAPRRCLVLVVGAGDDRSLVGGPCASDALTVEPLAWTPGESCAGGRAILALAAPVVRRVVVVLGDGRRRELPLVAFGGGTRAGALPLGDGPAVRRVVALDTDGRRLGDDRAAQPPTGATRALRCRRTGLGTSIYMSASSELDRPTPHLGPGPHALQLVDHGVDVCPAIDRAPLVPVDCGLPPTDPSFGTLRIDPTADGRVAYGVVPTEIAAARLVLDDGSTRTVMSQPLIGYPGIYGDTLRQVVADVPGPRFIDRVQLLDARGRALNTRQPFAYDPTRLGRAVTVAPARAGRSAVHAAAAPGPYRPQTCVAYGPLTTFDDCDDMVGATDAAFGTLRIDASCASRRLVVSAVLRRATDRLVVRTTRGREVTARAVRLPAATGAAAGRPLATAVLGPRDGITAVLLRGRAGSRIPLAFPPTTRQCGYVAAAGDGDFS
jgi:hypothetical protein